MLLLHPATLQRRSTYTSVSASILTPPHDKFPKDAEATLVGGGEKAGNKRESHVFACIDARRYLVVSFNGPQNTSFTDAMPAAAPAYGNARKVFTCSVHVKYHARSVRRMTRVVRGKQKKGPSLKAQSTRHVILHVELSKFV